MFKIIQGTLPSNIDEEELGRFRRIPPDAAKIEAEVRRQMGESDDDDNAGFIRALMSFPKIDCDDSIFDRHASNGDSDVSG